AAGLVESAGARNAAWILPGRIAIAPRDRALAAVIDGKDRNVILAEDQRGVEHAAGLGIDGDRLAHSRSEVGSARHGITTPSRCWRPNAGAPSRRSPLACAEMIEDAFGACPCDLTSDPFGSVLGELAQVRRRVEMR